MKTFISAIIIVLMLIGCSYDDSNILSSQQETNNKIDSLIVMVGESPPLTRMEMIKEKFNGLLAYVYKSVTVETGPEEEDHQHIKIRYAEYYTFTIDPSDFYDGWYSFNRYVLRDSYEALQAAGLNKFSNPAVFSSQGKWRLLSEKDIELARTYGTFYDFHKYDWDTIPAGIVAIDRYSYHGDKMMIGSARGGDTFRVTTIKDMASVTRGDFDR